MYNMSVSMHYSSASLFFCHIWPPLFCTILTVVYQRNTAVHTIQLMGLIKVRLGMHVKAKKKGIDPITRR